MTRNLEPRGAAPWELLPDAREMDEIVGRSWRSLLQVGRTSDLPGHRSGQYLSVDVRRHIAIFVPPDRITSAEWGIFVRGSTLTRRKSPHDLGTPKVSINTDAPPDKRSYRVDFGLYKKLAPDHQPRYNLEQTIKELSEGLTAMRFNDSQFRDSRLMRLKVLTTLQEKKQLNDNLQWA
jgi:hypothetical protein